MLLEMSFLAVNIDTQKKKEKKTQQVMLNRFTRNFAIISLLLSFVFVQQFNHLMS